MQLSRRALFSFKRRIPAAPSAGYWVHVNRAAMACRFEITLPAEIDYAVGPAREALDLVDALEAQMTIFRDSSELAAINRDAALMPVATEPRLFDLLAACADLHRETEGAFDITSTPLSRTWGFLRRAGRLPSDDELAEARAHVGMHFVTLDRAARTVRFTRPGIALNLGGVGKGYALDRVVEQLSGSRVPTALVTAGASSLRALGTGPDGDGYLVGLRDPFDHERRLGTVRLRGQALGVSGAGEQFFEAGGRRYGHILDPRSGWPVEGRALVAVVAPSAALADALATAFFVGGRQVAERYITGHDGVSAVVIDMPRQGEYAPPIILGRGAEWSFTRAI